MGMKREVSAGSTIGSAWRSWRADSTRRGRSGIAHRQGAVAWALRKLSSLADRAVIITGGGSGIGALLWKSSLQAQRSHSRYRGTNFADLVNDLSARCAHAPFLSDATSPDTSALVSAIEQHRQHAALPRAGQQCRQRRSSRVRCGHTEYWTADRNQSEASVLRRAAVAPLMKAAAADPSST